jgi:phospholipid/cholesterol/gamma-HCH transport system substrate-binding protein
MSISKEVRIGILFTVAILIFFVGFYFLKGSSFFSSEKEYYCVYQDVEGLQVSGNVMVKGLVVGRVEKMGLEGGKVKVTISVGKDVAIPVGTNANIGSTDLLGGKVVKLDLGPGPGMLPAGSMLLSSKEVGMMDKVSGELTPRLAELKTTISALDTTLAGINAIVGPQNRAAISAAIQSLNVTAENMARISGVLSRESGAMSNIIANTNNITANFARSNDTIRSIVNNVNRLTRQMANAPIEKTIADLQGATHQLKSIADKVNNNQGSLGMLVNSKELYNNLNGSVAAMRGLMEDMKANPKRYINLSVFGGGGKNKSK